MSIIVGGLFLLFVYSSLVVLKYCWTISRDVTYSWSWACNVTGRICGTDLAGVKLGTSTSITGDVTTNPTTWLTKPKTMFILNTNEKDILFWISSSTTILNYMWKVIRLTRVICNHALQSFQGCTSSYALHYVDKYWLDRYYMYYV